MRIGITGSIACGKSTVASYLRTLGYTVADADAISRSLTADGGPALPAIQAVFPECFTEKGTLNRSALGTIIFGNPAAKQQLEQILHPMIFREIDRVLDAVPPDQLVFADIPLLFECHMENQFDEIWVVTLDPQQQSQRLMARDGLTADEAQTRIRAHMPQEEKAARATRCISTNGTIEETEAQVDKILTSLQTRISATSRPMSENDVTVSPETSTSARLVITGSNKETSNEQHSIPASEPSASAVPPEPDNIPQATVVSLRSDTVGTRVNDFDLADFTKRRRRVRTIPIETIDTPDEAAEQIKAQPVRKKSRRKRTLKQRLRRIPLPVYLCLAAIFLISAFFGTRAFLRYREEQRRIAAEEAERARHPLYYGNLILSYASRQELDPALVAAVILCESSFDPRATSRLGARGLMQLMEDTASWIAHKLREDTPQYSFDLLYDPETNIRFGTWYLGYLSKRYGGDAKKTVCAYHAGQGNVDAWLKNPAYSADGITLTTIPTKDTATYASRVLNARDVYEKYYFPKTVEQPFDGTEPQYAM